MSNIHSVQYLRGLAASGVVLFHVSEQFQGPLALGAAGVDVFFVISGFIMWVTTFGRSISPAEFMWRRITRVVPIYWIATLLTGIALLLKPQFFPGHLLTPANLAGSMVFLPTVVDGKLLPVVIQAWTLCYEMMFYAIFAVTLLLPAAARLLALLTVLLLLVLAHFVLPPGLLAAFTSPLVLEFAAGVLIGWLWTSGRQLRLRHSVVLMLSAVILLPTLDMLPDLHRVIRWGLPAALLVAGAVFFERSRPVPVIGVLTYVGDASYSIYLWHVLTTVVATGIALHFDIQSQLLPPLVAGVGIISGMVFYELVEKPLGRRLHPTRKPLASPTPVGG